jgi:hypothetical protein
MNDQPLRLGFPVKVIGKPGLKSNDTRRWQKNPHLKTSLEYVSEILDYLARHKIGMYRPLVRPRALRWSRLFGQFGGVAKGPSGNR